MTLRIKKGDNVKVRIGKDRGKTGKVTAVDQKTGRIVIDGLNTVKKHVRPRRQGEKGEIVAVSRSIPAGNVMVVCPSCGAATRVGARMDGEKKVRTCKKCQATI